MSGQIETDIRAEREGGGTPQKEKQTRMTMSEMKAILRSHSLPLTGTKSVVCARLVAHLEDFRFVTSADTQILSAITYAYNCEQFVGVEGDVRGLRCGYKGREKEG